MTTSKKELAALLVEADETGREIQFKNRGTGDWSPSALDTDFEYRLKPIIKYYRVWWDEKNRTTRVGVSKCPLDCWSDSPWNCDGNEFIHDFEIEQ